MWWIIQSYWDIPNLKLLICIEICVYSLEVIFPRDRFTCTPHTYWERKRERLKDVLWLCHCHTSKWKVLCRNVYFIYICWNIHSSWQRQKKTKRKIRLNCYKWSKLQRQNKVWLPCYFFFYRTRLFRQHFGDTHQETEKKKWKCVFGASFSAVA